MPGSVYGWKWKSTRGVGSPPASLSEATSPLSRFPTPLAAAIRRLTWALWFEL
jgi:hypothetical protein